MAEGAFEQTHDAGINRSGIAELEVQQKVYDEMDDHVLQTNVNLEQLRIHLTALFNAQSEATEDYLQLQRRYTVMTKRLESSCNRVVESVDTMQLVEIDFDKKEIENLYTTLQGVALDCMSEAGDQDAILEQEEVSSELYKNTLLTLMTAKANRNVQPLAPGASVGTDADMLKVLCRFVGNLRSGRHSVNHSHMEFTCE